MADGAGVLDLAAALVTAVALLTLPGWLVARGWGLRGWAAAALSVPLSCLVVGVAGLLGPVAGVAWLPYGWILIAGMTCALAAAGALADRVSRRGRLSGHGTEPDCPDTSELSAGAGSSGGRAVLPSARPRHDARQSQGLPLPSGPRVNSVPAGARRAALMLPLAAVGAGALLAACLLIGDAWGTGRLDAPAQAFDAVFHLSAVQTIRADGNVSSLGGLASMYGGRTVYYPLVWHAIAALLPGSVPLAANALVAAMAGIWPAALASLLATVQLPDAAARLRPLASAGCGMGRDDRVAVRVRDSSGPAGLAAHAAGALAPPWEPDAVSRTGAGVVRPQEVSNLPETGVPGRLGATVVVLLSAGGLGVPVVLLTTLSVWPYALSVLCLPGVLAGAVMCSRAWRCGGPAAWPLAVVTVLAAGGAVLAHGAAVFNLAVLALPAVVAGAWWAVRAPSGPGRVGATDIPETAVACGVAQRVDDAVGTGTPGRDGQSGAPMSGAEPVRRRCLGRKARGGVVLAAMLLAGAGGAWAMRGPLASVLGYQRPGGSAAGTLAQAVAGLPMYGPVGYGAAVPLGLVTTALAVAGWWGGRHRPSVRLWAATAALALVLVVLTGGPDWPLRQLGAPWYLQKARIVPLVVIPALVLAAGGAQWWWERRDGERLTGRRYGRQGRLAALCTVGALLVAGRVPALVQQARLVHDPGQVLYGTLATSGELDFYQRVAGELPRDAVVIGAPSRGVSYLWSVAGVRVLYPMRAEPDGAAWDLAGLAPGESGFCAALDQAGAEVTAGTAGGVGDSGPAWYYLQVEREERAFRYGSAPLRWDARLADWDTTGMELVDHAVTPTGTVSLWRLAECESRN